MRVVRVFCAALAIAGCCAQAAMAVVQRGSHWTATYVAAYEPAFHGGAPYSGEMKLTVDRGIVSGRYTSTSVKPDPLRGRIVTITGTVQHGNIYLDVGGSGGFSVRGTLGTDGSISGTATQRGVAYTFLAKVKSSP